MSALTLSGKIRELLKIMGLAVDLPLLEALQIMEAAIGIVASAERGSSVLTGSRRPSAPRRQMQTMC